MSFLNLPHHRPAALVRLPPRGGQIATASTDDEKTSEQSSSAGANMTSSVSTLASRATTADTVDTEVSLGPKADESSADDKRKKKAAAVKEKRKRRKAKAAAEKAASKTTAEDAEASDEDDVEEDEQQAQADTRPKEPTTLLATQDVSAPMPTASTSKTPAASTDWADMTTEDETAEAQILTIPTGPRAQLNRFPSDPSITPRLGKFWGHDERAQDRKGKQPSVQSPLSPGFSLSRRNSASTDAMDRAASPALSSGSGWQKVSRGGKRNAFGMPTNSTSCHQRYQEPPWKHDRFEDEAANRPKVSLGGYSNDAPRMEDSHAQRVSPFASRAPEPPWTARSPVPYLFNEPGSRTVIDDATGKRKITLRISLQPVPALLEPGSKKMARQRANVIELCCFLHFDEEWPRPGAVPASEDIVYIVKLQANSPGIKILTPAAEAKRQQRQAELEAEAQRAEEEKVVLAEAKRVQDEQMAQERGRERAKVERQLAEEESQRQAQSARGILYSAAPTPEASELSFRPQSVQQEHNAPHHYSPSIGQEQMQGPAPLPYSPHDHPHQQVYGAPPPQPFVGQDGHPYIVDPVTGHVQPFHGGFYGAPLPHMAMHQHPSSPGYFYDPAMVAPSPSQSPPLSTHTPAFFAPPKSHRLEIRAPLAEDNEKRNALKKQHRSYLSSSSRQSPLSHSTSSQQLHHHESENTHLFNQHQQQHLVHPNVDEQYIPGSYFDSSGVMHFLPPNYNYYSQPQPVFFPPPPQYAADPAILFMGNEMQQHQPQQEQQTPQQETSVA